MCKARPTSYLNMINSTHKVKFFLCEITFLKIVYTYILELSNNCWYIGKSTKINSRIRDHFSGNGSEWTKLHKPIKVTAVLLGDCEKEILIKFMLKYGWKNVRGYCWSQTIISESKIQDFLKCQKTIEI